MSLRGLRAQRDYKHWRSTDWPAAEGFAVNQSGVFCAVCSAVVRALLAKGTTRWPADADAATPPRARQAMQDNIRKRIPDDAHNVWGVLLLTGQIATTKQRLLYEGRGELQRNEVVVTPRQRLEHQGPQVQATPARPAHSVPVCLCRH